MDDPLLVLADKIELHVKLRCDAGYYLTEEDQEAIIRCLRFTSRALKMHEETHGADSSE